MNEVLIIPQHISIYGCYTSLCIFIGGICAGMCQFYIQSMLAILLSITSYMNWKKVLLFGWIKFFDILLASTLILYISFVDSYRFYPTSRFVWITAVGIVVVVFIMNEMLFYYQVKKPIYLDDIPYSSYRYFSTYYTAPGTPHREYAEYRSTFTHIVTIHIFLVGACIYCMYHSHAIPISPIKEILKLPNTC